MLFLHDGTSLCVTTSCNSHIKPQCVAIVKRMSQIHGNDLMEKGVNRLMCNCKRSSHMADHINSGSQNNWQHSVSMKTYLNSVHTSREVISPEGISLSIWYRGGSLRIFTLSLSVWWHLLLGDDKKSCHSHKKPQCIVIIKNMSQTHGDEAKVSKNNKQ